MRFRLLPLLVGLALGGCAWPFGAPKSPRAEKMLPAPAAAAAAAPGAPPAAAPGVEVDGVVDRIVAIVNSDVITLTELREQVLYYKMEARGQDMPEEDQLARRLLDRLIESRLQFQEAEREGVTIEDAELSEEIAARMKKLNLATEHDFDEAIKKQGLSVDQVRKRLREQLMVAKVIRRKVSFRVSVTEEEVDRYLKDNRAKLETGLTYRARHILIAPAGARTDAAWGKAREQAEAVFARLKGGADFAEVAKEVSQDATAKDGGDLGSLKKGELADEIESRILKLAPGQISEPFRTELGYHIAKLEARETLEGEGLTRLRQQIRDVLFRDKYQARLDAWLAEIRKRAIIEVRI
jgi:peptidyl-prolyl cis-trans isomerase SurA